MKAISKKEAKEKGLSKYYTGKLCKWGHDSERRVAGGECIECQKVRDQKRHNEKYVRKGKRRAKTVEGKPCKICGNTTRYKSGRGNCVDCSIKRGIEYSEKRKNESEEAKNTRIQERKLERQRRREAREKGETKYIGIECKNCGNKIKFTKGQRCVECHKSYYKNYHTENKEELRQKSKVRSKKHYEDNREEILENQKIYYEENKEKISVRNKEYHKRNPEKRRARRARRRAQELKATPEWADMDKVYFFYECCPAGCHVDHIIPLNHPLVCGLHNEFNLQWLPAEENLSKGNKFDLGEFKG